MWNKLCEIEDFRDPAIARTIRDVEPEHAGIEHRKVWERAQLIAGLDRLNALSADSLVLAVAAGQDRSAFALTRRARMVFATDLYGTAGAPAAMLTEPESFAPAHYARNRLVVQFMDAVDLRYEDGTFDLVYCLGSIHRFGGFEGAREALGEMARVAKPGGIVMFTTECIVNGVVPPRLMKPELFPPIVLDRLVSAVPSLEPVEPLCYTVSDSTRRSVQNFDALAAGASETAVHTPHVVLEIGGCEFTSVSIFLRKHS